MCEKIFIKIIKHPSTCFCPPYSFKIQTSKFFYYPWNIYLSNFREWFLKNLKTYHFRDYFKFYKINFEKFQSDLFKRSNTVFFIQKTRFVQTSITQKIWGFSKNYVLWRIINKAYFIFKNLECCYWNYGKNIYFPILLEVKR